MPYKDPEAKKEWERQHRRQRLARRRELRRVGAERREVQSEALGGAGFLLPLAAGGALAAYNPKLAMAAGGGTLAVAAIFRKGWAWWALGALVLAVALFFYWNGQNADDPQPENEKEKI